MRKQYSFVPAPSGYDAWDVDLLIERAAQLPVTEVAIDEIRELDEVYWFGESGIAATVRVMVEHARLIREADLRYPIILGADGRVMDGMHRVAKALIHNASSLPAKRFVQDPEPDYVGVAPDDLPY